MITKFTNYIVESRKSVDELEVLTPDQLGKLLIAEMGKPGYLKIPLDVQYIKDLIAVGCPIDSRDDLGRTALYWAACKGHLEIVKFLISNGAQVDAKDNNGRTALHQASDYNRLEVVEFLVQEGADINIRDDWNQTALPIAVRGRNLELVNFLLSNGAQVDIRDNDGWTAWDYANSEIRAKFPELNPNK